MPQYIMTSLGNVSGYSTGYNFGCTPFIKAEGAFRLGWVFKIRAMYTIGDIDLLRIQAAIPGVTDGPFRIVSTNNIVLSFIIMPFSLSWRETDWWNTHDTYNQHDRFN